MTAARPACAEYVNDLTGAGFGGCTVNLVAEAEAEAFAAALLAGYKEKTGLDGEIYRSKPSEGASILE